MDESAVGQVLREMYDRLASAYGPQHWWPAQTATEVVVGAILTQNTAWTNVERAIAVLEDSACLTWEALREVSEQSLARMIRSSGTYRIKAARLKAFVGVLWSAHDGLLESLLGGELEAARARLLAISGVGPETADSVLLYAGGRRTFVVDAYTRRVLRRHGLIEAKTGYEDIRKMFHAALGADVQVFNEYHALMVEVGKRHCRPQARCTGCPLASLPHQEQA
ncbi:MAG: endonuclease III domain-containing protein [bacterium]|nr:endonuclease III domain-containing protein [bacterium]